MARPPHSEGLQIMPKAEADKISGVESLRSEFRAWEGCQCYARRLELRCVELSHFITEVSRALGAPRQITAVLGEIKRLQGKFRPRDMPRDL